MPPQPPPPAPVVTGGAIVAGGSPAVTSSASLAAQAGLAASFYAAQSYLAVAATRDILQVWQALNLRDVRQSWPALRTALAALIRDRHGQAAQLGTGYYRQARQAAGILTEAPRIVVPPLPEPQITATLDSMGPWNLLGKIKQGQQVADANENTGRATGRGSYPADHQRSPSGRARAGEARRRGCRLDAGHIRKPVLLVRPAWRAAESCTGPRSRQGLRRSRLSRGG